MLGQYVPARRTPLDEIDAIRAIRAAFVAQHHYEPTAETLALLAAHCALEVGRWKACWNHCWGNIKAGPKWTGLYTAYRCNELLKDPDGVKRYHWFEPHGEVTKYDGELKGKRWDVPEGHPQTRFRAHESAPKGAAEHLHFFAYARYQPAWKLALAGNPVAFVMALHEAGYFTAQPRPYAKSVESIAREYRGRITKSQLLFEPNLIKVPSLEPEPVEPERSPMTDHDLRERAQFFALDGMINLEGRYWDEDFYAARDAAIAAKDFGQ